MPKPRYSLLDLIRGLALVSMMAYHASWDLVYLFGVDWPWYHSEGAFLWQQATCWTFILLSGFCAPMGRSRYKRGLTVFACGWIITLVMKLFMPATPNLFGILVFLGSAMMIVHALRGVLAKLPPLPGAWLSFLTFIGLRWINRGTIGWGRLTLTLPEGLYRNDFTAFLGFPHSGFRSTDYFALLPWFFLFLTGYFIYRLAEKKGWLAHLPDLQLPVLNLLGRYSLYVYMAHQPVIYGILWLVFSVI
ncbi:MAG: DUF1624 domain-containing protein [Clostridia bacterium]|nr:DUF1624 domain-containing protein [Clostridia bacterium]